MRWRSNTGSNNNSWQSEGTVQIVAGSAQARNDFITYVAEDIDYSHVPPRQNHATSHILPGAYFLSNSHSQTTEKYIFMPLPFTLPFSFHGNLMRISYCKRQTRAGLGNKASARLHALQICDIHNSRVNG